MSKFTASRPDAIHVLVADEIPEASRNVLARAGWGYLDRRGHLQIMDAPSTMLIDVDVDPLVRSVPTSPNQYGEPLGSPMRPPFSWSPMITRPSTRSCTPGASLSLNRGRCGAFDP